MTKLYGFAIGMAVGSGIMLLLAPQRGRDTRRALNKTWRRGQRQAKELYRTGDKMYRRGRSAARTANGAWEAAVEAGKAAWSTIH